MEEQKPKTKATAISELPEYETIFSQFFQDTVNTFMSLKSDMLPGIQMSNHEGPISMRTNVNEEVIDKEPSLVEMSFNIPYESIINTDINCLIMAIEEASDSGLQSLIPQVFDFLSEVCEASGQVVDGKGQPYSFDLFLELLEKIEITFEDDGTPNMPTMVVNPKMREVIEKNPPTKEQEKKMEELINKKRNDFFAKKRTRRLY